jgi:hypothetical protein
MVDEDSQKKITADFQCFVCGAIFTSEEDRRQHLEKYSINTATRSHIVVFQFLFACVSLLASSLVVRLRLYQE